MQLLNLPHYNFTIKKDEKGAKIFDPIRKKYLVLQPEEWVRQNFTRYLIDEKNVPRELLNNEITLKINGMNKRCDSVFFTPQGKPLTIVEYKAPEIPITQKTFNQITMYNMKLHVPFLIVSNGLVHYCCYINYRNSVVQFLAEIPTYIQMLSLIEE